MGGKHTRKRPKIGNLTDYEALMNTATEKNLQYEKNPSKDSNIEPDLTDGMEMKKDDLFSKGFDSLIICLLLSFLSQK